MYKGFGAGLIAQVPYTVVLLGTFEFMEKTALQQNQQLKFNKNDDYPFAIKFIQRFGASTLSLVFAQSLLYPFDTIKRNLQLSGQIGHKKLEKETILGCFKQIKSEHGIKGLYQGFTLNLARTAPMTVAHFIVFQALRGISKPKVEGWNNI